VPVNGGEYVVTVLPGGKVQSALGGFFKTIQIDISQKISVQQALSFARHNVPPKVVLKDSVNYFQLIVYPKDTTYFLAWELRISPTQDIGEWIYVIDASNGALLERRNSIINELSHGGEDEPQANVYLHHPYIDQNYTNLYLVYIDNSGYLQGSYANVVNDATSRAYNSKFNFAYQPSNTHFDEANLFYHITNYRVNLWNGLGFGAFGQITAHAHHTYPDGPNAGYDPSSHQLYFSDGQGVYGFNSFAKEDKVIMHEYTHAVTDYTAHLAYTYTESGAIHEGNSDFFAGSFTTRTQINEYCCYAEPIDQRDMASPRIATYTQYNDPNLSYWIIYGYHEPHFGGELWSRCLWDLLSSTQITKYYADRDIYYGLYGIPTNSSFLQYRQAIMNADNNYFAGTHVAAIQNAFALRGIGTPTSPIISGPQELYVGQQGTWTVSTNWGSGYYSYAWYFRSNDTGGQWYGPAGWTSSYTTHMYDFDGYLDLRVDVTAQITRVDGTIGALSSSSTYYVACADCEPCPGCPQKLSQPYDSTRFVASGTIAPKEYMLRQNFPNPFNPSTEIKFAVPEAAHVKVVVLDLLGREVATLMDQPLSASYHSLRWRGTDAAGNNVGSGVYFCRITAQGVSGKQFVRTIKMILIR
jgi:Zn-dependent metalloprotease